MEENVKDKWFSMEGYLQMKYLSSALSYFQSRKRYYFGLDEGTDSLLYFKDKSDFDKRLNCLGSIPLNGAICVPAPTPKMFTLHIDYKKYEIEGETSKATQCWINALQRRRDLKENINWELPCIVFNSIRRTRSRSRSVHSLSDTASSTPKRRPKQPPTRRKVIKLESNRQRSLQAPCPLHSPPANSNCSNLVESRLSRCISMNQTMRKESLAVPMSSDTTRRNTLQPQQLSSHIHRMTESKPPTWLEEWVEKWLNEQMDGGFVARKITRRHSEIPDLSKQLSKVSEAKISTKSSSSVTSGPDSHLGDEHHDIMASSTATTCQLNYENGDLHPKAESCSDFCLETDRSSLNSSGASFPEVYDELIMLREVDNQQKARIHSLTMQLEKLRAKQFINGSAKDMDESALLEQNRLLNTELIKLNDKCRIMEKEMEIWRTKVEVLENMMENFKREYVYLLQSCVRIPLHEHSTCDAIQVKLFGGAVHENRVKQLLAEARQEDPKLPTVESVTTPGNYHVDDYGFRHSFEETPLALHYICTQLNSHYYAQSDDYARLKSRWRTLLDSNPQKIENNKGNRQLCRSGIPRSMRSAVWRVLINQEVADLKEKYGEYYYRNLCSSQGTPSEKIYCTSHQKQINLDLLRTMPSNVHFMSASCKGVNHLQAVLRSFCLHNPSLGYCQGMNFLAATALLFVSPEDAFWFLIAVTERYFDSSYFDQNLSGAQADQEVLKELVELKFPKLSKHLEECDIDLTTVTLNWFLALFFDAVPFQTMLRIWDCFLLEGAKVLFRFTVALLGQYQDEILDRTDTIAVMKVLKAAVRLTYDVDGLIKFAFDDLQPFPSRTTLKNKHSGYLELLKVRLNQRMVLRNCLDVTNISSETSEKICDLPVEQIVFNDHKPGVGFVCAGNQKRGKIARVSIGECIATMSTLDIEFDCRPVSMVILKEEMAFVSLLSGYIVALSVVERKEEILWELKLNDVALKLLYHEERLYAALANGTLTVLENVFVKRPTCLDLYHIPIAAAPITDAIMDEECLYLAVACKVVILNKETLSTISNMYVASSACGSHVPMFEKIRAFADSPYGIWLITAHSSLVQLWLESECQILFDITYDHSQSSRRPSFDEHDQLQTVEVYSIMYHENELWIGTVDGYLMLYTVSQVEDSWERKGSVGKRAAKLHERYPPGKRLSPVQSNVAESPFMRQTMYYIPTDKERLLEEIASAKEYPESERQTRKISVIIDPSTKQYKVNVEDIRQISAESHSETSSNMNSLSPKSVASSSLSPGADSLNVSDKSQPKLKAKLCKGYSADSAVSLKSVDGSRYQTACEVIPETSDTSQLKSQQSNGSPSATNKRKTLRQRRNPNAEYLSCWTGEGSMEYDDTFDLYSEVDDALRNQIGLLEESLAQNSPSIHKSIQIPVRKMSSKVFGKYKSLTIDESRSDTDNASQSSDSVSQRSLSSAESGARNRVLQRVLSERLSKQKLKLRRRDLDIPTNAAMLVALKERERVDPSTALTFTTSILPTEPSTSAVSDSDSRPKAPKILSRKCSAIYQENGHEEPLAEKPVRYSIKMQLQMKLKVSDKPLKCITLTRYNGEPTVITGAGNYGDEEAILRWRRDKISGLWINDPLADAQMSGRRRTTISNGKLPRK
ncbi:unnamed protein product [Bursaphelenchus xylophilus]|uniref:(pine wood nematode) hypothetical protein n=1 Tax=Bursaphelenchus xylophilus TaxID=6326 RepID=A0A1I7RRE0_BURXY|nr:unnamed protein product [Bursaphelenchus xylophilus]CAG9130970.1 unnamed protein product [Bursaphelenchus xylophilus]